jgi:hypothetical protein
MVGHVRHFQTSAPRAAHFSLSGSLMPFEGEYVWLEPEQVVIEARLVVELLVLARMITER